MSCRVTVVGARRRLDADLPDSVPVAELLADVAGLLGESPNGVAVEWGLLRVGGARLDPELSLGDQGVADGALLFLRDLATAPATPTIDDFAGQVAVLVDAQKGRWSLATPAAILGWIAAGCLAAAGLTVLAAGDASGRATGGVLAAAASGLAGLALVRLLARRRLAAVVMLGALPAWVAAGAGLAGLGGANAPMAVAFALAAATVGALATLAVAGDVVVALVDGVVEATAPPALVLGVAAAFGAGVLQAAAVLLVVEVVLLAMMPVANERLLRGASAGGLALARRLYVGRRVEAASRIASALVIVSSSAVLAVSGGWFARGLVAATAIATVLRARHYRFAAEATPLVVAGIAGLLLLELPLASWLAIGIRGAAGLALLLAADAFVLVAAAVLVPRWSLPPRLTAWLRPLELLAVAATVPLALGALGLYDAVAHYVRSLG